MDIFKGIGDFFGGLFGQKKKREDEQQQPQQQSAVSFNNAPKLGDNFINNLNNLTQPQQPKEFAKSSVDLNPVKPVQPVQPQPQMNRDQERQQLANKYRQEETDRYNQGSDHTANFLNDIFSGGKTAQMRENTINQNIQNRVNAEMLRKYGPDDQQVKQNIAQTSQDINNKAASVNDFTKNYNNTVQQTVTSPVSAVKGAANSVVETVPKVSGASGLDLFTNNYKNIDTSLLHPNCTCIERFKVTNVETNEKPKSILESTPEKVVNDLTAEEKAFIYDFERNGYKIDKVISKDYETFKPTNDFIINGLEWEMKTPEKSLKYSTMSTHIRNAIKQNKENFIINLQGKYYSEKALRQLSDYNSRNPSYKLKNLVIYKQGKIMQLIGDNSINKK